MSFQKHVFPFEKEHNFLEKKRADIIKSECFWEKMNKHFWKRNTTFRKTKKHFRKGMHDKKENKRNVDR